MDHAACGSGETALQPAAQRLFGVGERPSEYAADPKHGRRRKQGPTRRARLDHADPETLRAEKGAGTDLATYRLIIKYSLTSFGM